MLETFEPLFVGKEMTHTLPFSIMMVQKMSLNLIRPAIYEQQFK